MSSKNSDFDIRGDLTPTTPIQWKFYSYGYDYDPNHRYNYPTTKRTILDEQKIEGLKLNHVYR
jgi:hypothetical protein